MAIQQKLSSYWRANNCLHHTLRSLVDAGIFYKKLKYSCLFIPLFIGDLFTNLPPRNQPCQVVLRYNPDGRVAEEQLRDRTGQTVVILRYSYPSGYAEGKAAVPATVEFINDRLEPIRTPTGIEGYELYRDQQGRDSILRFLQAGSLASRLDDRSRCGRR